MADRVEELADREEGFKPKNFPGLKHLVPLAEVIADIKEVGANSKTVQTEYDSITSALGSEIDILERIPIQKIRSYTSPEISNAIEMVRAGKVKAKAGYDGVYGVISVKNLDKSTGGLEGATQGEAPAQETLF